VGVRACAVRSSTSTSVRGRCRRASGRPPRLSAALASGPTASVVLPLSETTVTLVASPLAVYHRPRNDFGAGGGGGAEAHTDEQDVIYTCIAGHQAIFEGSGPIPPLPRPLTSTVYLRCTAGSTSCSELTDQIEKLQELSLYLSLSV